MPTSIIWPATLPAPLLPLGFEPVDVSVQTRQLSGRTRSRLVREEAPAQGTLNFALTGEQFVIFKQFWRNQLQQGTQAFLLELDAGDGLASHELLFLGMYQYQQTGQNRFELSCKAEVFRLLDSSL